MSGGETPWYADGLRFGCTGCGACCQGVGFVWVDEREIGALAELLGVSKHDFGRRYLRRVGRRLALIDGPHDSCIFWADGCQVYPARPRQCRTFPFWRKHLTSEESWRRVQVESPGVGSGRLYTRAEIDALAAGEGAATVASEPMGEAP